MPTDPILSAHAVTRRYGDGDQALDVLRGVDLDLLPGEATAITGPSGSGKTSLLHVLAGLLPPTSGHVTFRGARLADRDPEALAAWRREHVGFIFQDFRLLPRLTARENVALPLELLGRPPREAADRAREALDRLGLGARLDHLPAQLSGGEQQRVAIGRAFIHAPAIVFADEPTGNLDPHTSRRVVDELLAVHAAAGAAVVVVTHDDDVADAMDRRVRLAEGRVA